MSATLLRTCEFVDNRNSRSPEELLTDFADTISRMGAAIPPFSTAGLILGVEHAELLAGNGFAGSESVFEKWGRWVGGVSA